MRKPEQEDRPMSTQTPPTNAPVTPLPPQPGAAWTWPPDVLDFAARQGVAAFLDPLLQGTRQLFPAALGIEVYLSEDPASPGGRTIIFLVRVPSADVPDFLATFKAWTREFVRLCPGDEGQVFGKVLLQVEP
jgi:hypothetical protein